MAGTLFQELLDGVANYYGAGSDQWAEIARYGVNQQTLPIIQQVPGVTVTLSNSGKYLGYDYNKAFASVSNPASAIDSNVQSGSYGTGSFNARLPATAVTDASTGTTTMQSGARAVSTGSTVATIADRVSLGVAGVALGTKLGKLINSAIYSADPDWWDTNFPTINPETWDDIATTQGGKNFIRSIFGLQNDSATMYIDERALAYTYMMLLQNGAYSTGGYETDQSRVPSSYLQYPNTQYHIECGTYLDTLTINDPVNPTITWRRQYGFTTGEGYIVAYSLNNSNGEASVYYCSENPGAVGWYQENTGTIKQRPLTQTWTHGGKTIYYAQAGLGLRDSTTSTLYTFQRSYYNGNNASFYDALMIALFGTIETAGLDGIENNPLANEYINPQSLINPTTGQPVTPNDDPADVLQALKNLYPDLFNDSIYEDVPQSDGTIQRLTYIPVPYPDTMNSQQPITDTTPGINPQTTPQVNSNTRTDELLQQLTNTLVQDSTVPGTGEGNTPPAIIPTGSANALYSIYNPTQTELNNFGTWLWSNNFVDQLLKLFNDPMQAIIGLHKVFAPPVISGASTIRVGYLDSNVSSNVVGNQYVTVDCGSVNVSEYFGNVFDYDPFTQIYIYLPFVGIEKLDTGDVMRGVIGVRYHVDVLTGACLAEISVTRDGAGGILYTFAGNCAVQYPISSGSYMGIVASLTSIAGGVVGTIASGGALAPVAMGAVNGIMNAHARVNHSGAFSGNAGAMGAKIPYLIITRPQTCLADNFSAFDGYPANKTTTLSECSGFVKCETCHIENIPATDAELSELEMLLKSGIII